MHVLVIACILLLSIFQIVLGAPLSVNDSPITQSTDGALVVLAPAIAILAVFLVLFALKWLYIVRRRSQMALTRQSADADFGWYDNSLSNSSRPAVPLVSPKKAKSGFWIGLLGSPSWETRYSALITSVSGQLSLTQDNSLSSRKSDYRGSSTGNNSHRSKGYANLDLSARIPAEKQEKQSPTSAAIKVFRELSFPSPAITFTKSPPPAESASVLPLKANPHLKLPAPALISKTTIPVASPGLDAYMTATRFSLSPTISTYPFSPSFQISSSTPKASNQPVSLPTYYGLFNTSLSSLPPISRSNADMPTHRKFPPNLLVSPSISEPWTDQSFRPDLESPTPKPLPQMSPPASIPISSPRSPILAPHASEFHPLKVQRTRSKTKGTGRTRSSPKLGPSPLRKSIVPSKSSSESLKLLAQNSPASSPPLGDSLSNLNPPKKRGKSTDNDSLLELMAELVEETNAWDPSLFVDSNFKALIAETTGKPNFSPSIEASPIGATSAQKSAKRQSWRSSRTRRWSRIVTTLEDIPEVDVTEMMPLQAAEDSFQSFWEDEEDCQMLIGIAQ